MYTRAQLVNEALDQLGVTAVGQTADPESYGKVDGKVNATLSSLASRELVYVPDPDNIPDDIFNQLAAILAEECKTKFGLAADEVAKLETDRVQAELEIREIVRGRPTFEPQRSHYF